MQLNKFKKALEAEKQEIAMRSQLIKAQEIDVGKDEIDLIQARILALASNQLVVRDQVKLRKIDIALKRIEEGTFGICEGCEDSINERRLMIDPIFNLCISCSEGIELAKKRS